MIRTLMFAGVVGLASMGASSAAEPSHVKFFDFNLNTYNGGSFCGPIEIAKLTKKNMRLPPNLVSGFLYNSQCNKGNDVVLMGSIGKYGLSLYEQVLDQIGEFSVIDIQWPLQQNGNWKSYSCRPAGGQCLSTGGGTYEISNARRGAK